jgi:hypothetical protein
MSNSESEDIRNIFFENKIQRRILELLDSELQDEKIVDKLLEEVDSH